MFADRHLVTEAEYIGQLLRKEHWMFGKIRQLAVRVLFLCKW